MGPVMTRDSSNSDDLLRRAEAGDQQALAELFSRYRDRLRQMVRLRLDRRLQGRIDPSDVLQEAYLDLAKRFAGVLAKAHNAFFPLAAVSDRPEINRFAPPPSGCENARRGSGSFSLSRGPNVIPSKPWPRSFSSAIGAASGRR
jgi:hypothetical protein